jgi:cytochrome c peroxidase
MNKNKYVLASVLIMLVVGLSSCTDDEEIKVIESSVLNLPESPYNYANLNLPSYFTTGVQIGPNNTSINGTDNTPANNVTTNDGATLGRVLFYDKKLSANGKIACASCHKQDKSFSDDAILSLGFDGGKTGRHSMTLINARYYARGRFFWDERAATLEEQVLMPFQDPVEMGMTLDQIVNTVKSQSYYPDLFLKAFGSEEVTSDRISKALAQFVRSIVSYSSKYDEGRAMATSPIASFPNFTAEENMGKDIFFKPIPQRGGACVACHTTEAFIGSNIGPENNGLDAISTTDLGAGNGRFKTTSLRNIALTAPYMHDGRFATLEEVVEHYNSGIKAHPNLSPVLRTPNNGGPVRLNLNNTQKSALVAFLKTLTDHSIASEVKWSDPFK